MAADAVKLLNQLSPAELIQVADGVTVEALLGLVPRGQQRLNALQGLTSAPAISKGKVRENKGHDNKGFEKGEGKGGKGSKNGKAPMPIPPPLDQPEALPATAGHEAVAFQVNVGTPWRLLGPQGGTFRWDLQDRDVVSEADKREIREILQGFAETHGIPLRGGVKLALQRGDYWVSYAGGISSA